MNSNPTLPFHDEFLLDPNIIYLNHASFGATPRPVFESYQKWQRELEFQPTKFITGRAAQLMSESRAVLANFLGTTPDHLAYVTNVTFGLNVAARCIQLAEGDEVLSTDHEYGALDRTWQFLSQKQGFKYINQPIPLPVTTKENFVETLWKGVTPRTRVIFLSHITSPTALIFPIREVCQRAHQEGILTVIDGAHAPGQIDLSLDDLGADFYAGNLHKWLCAPKGSAFLYARSEQYASIKPLVVGWGWQPGVTSPSPLQDYVEHMGTRDFSAFLAVPDVIQYMKDHEWSKVRLECHGLAQMALQRISLLTGLPPTSPDSTEWYSQMISIPLPSPANLSGLQSVIDGKYHIVVPLITWKDCKFIRCSFQAYNSIDDVLVLEKALKEGFSIAA